MTINQTAPVTDEELEQLIWGLERYGLYPRQLAALKELREVRRAKGEPVAVVDIQRERGDGRKYALCFTSAGHSLPDDVYNLYTVPPAVKEAK